MEPAQLIAILLGSTVIGGIIAKLLDWFKDWRTGAAAKRHAEVQKAFQERDAFAEQNRQLRETLAKHRRLMIDAPCIDINDPEQFPPYPSTPTE